MTQPLQTLTRIFASLALIGLIATSYTSPVSAVSGKTEMTLSPAKVTPQLKKGQVYNGEFSLHNTGEVDFKAKVYTSQYEATNDGYKLNSSSDRSLLHKWIKFEQEQFEIKAGQSAVVKYSIHTPNDLPDGGQYGLIFAETINDKDSQSSEVTTTSRLGMLIFASTDGQNRYEGQLHSPQIPFLNIGPKATFSFKVKNSGNTHFDTNGEISITDMFDNQKFGLIKNSVTSLPNTDKKFEFEWDRAPLIALMKVKLKGQALDNKIDETRTVLFISPIFFITVIVIIIILGATYVAIKKSQYQYKK